MSGPTVVPPGGGELIADSPERRVEVLCDEPALAATWSRFAPGREGASLHVHRGHHDVFYVLDGELTVRLGVEDRPVTATAGTLARVPPLVVHGFRNGSGADMRYLNFHAPGSAFADYLRGLRDGREVSFDQHPPPGDGGRPTSEAVVARAAPGERAARLVELDELAVTELRLDPEAPVEAQVSPAAVGGCFVLEGELTVTAEGRESRAVAGSWIRLPSGASHALAAAGGSPARVLDVRAPAPR